MFNILKKDLGNSASAKRAKDLARFFKTGPGEYGQGDIFIGVAVPDERKIAKKYWYSLGLADAEKLLQSKIHEERMTTLFILVEKFRKGDAREKEKIYKIYLRNTKHINNWDLVDLSAPNIVGGFLFDKPKAILCKLAKSENLWERRIAMLATFNFIYNGKCDEALEIAKILISDEHDLIHKAVGWMLREVGKRCSQKILEDFLKNRYQKMPRTMLRYAIEKMPETKKQKYLKGKI